jgi:preprotein translocase subunit Sec61beta
MMDAFKAVFWSFFGVRKKSEYDKDAKQLTPQAVIAAGLVSALVFVLAILGIVKLVTR